VTTHIFYQPSGTSNQLNGISPDIIIPDMNSIWDIGEAREKYPLKWAPIPRAPFRPANNVTPAIVQQLQSLSHNRVRSSSEFRELQVKIEKFKKQLNTKTISLKEESTIEKQREKELEKTLDKDKSRKLIDIKNDLFLREAFNVTLDYLRTQQKQK
jgi:carboxyl-terminal processing protease